MRFPALTGMRAIAVWMVTAFHISVNSKVAVGHPGLLGYLGVMVFFVLSGFLISYRYAESVSPERSWFIRYFVRRFARIYPVYFLLVTAAYFFSSLRGIEIDWSTTWIHYTLLRGYFPSELGVGITQAWSLTVEETFYLFAPGIFLLLKRGVSLLLIVLLVYLIGGLSIVSGLVHQVEYFVLYSFFGRVFEFAVGIFVAQSFNTQRSGWLYSIPKPTTVGLLLFGLGSYIISGRPTWDPIGFTGVAFGLPIAVGLIFFGLISESTGVSRVLSTPVMNLLGRTSYIYYLIHVGPISVFFVGILTHFIPTMQDIVLRRVVMFIFLNLLALFIFRFLEEPVGRWIRGSIKASVKKPTA